MTTLKPPFIYFGGKVNVAERIVALLPDHEHYIEPYCGSLAVLLAKPPSRMETVNDLDGRLVAFWKILRDRPADLERVCALTPHSRAEYQAAYEGAEDELEQARRVWVILTQGRSGSLRPTGWRFFQDPSGSHSLSMPGYLAAYVSRIPPDARRLVGVSLECRPAIEMVAAYGRHPGNLLYVDPPYLESLRADRSRDQYQCEMRGEDEHRELLEHLLGCRASVVLSGYASPLYDDLLCTWSRREVATRTGNGGGNQARTEVVWCNRPFPQATLFDLAAS